MKKEIISPILAIVAACAFLVFCPYLFTVMAHIWEGAYAWDCHYEGGEWVGTTTAWEGYTHVCSAPV